MNRKMKMRHAAGWLLAVFTVLLSIALIVQCQNIYRAGMRAENRTETGVLIEDVYSREIITQKLREISGLLWVWIFALIAALVLRVSACGEKNPPADADIAMRLRLVSARITPTQAMLLHRRKRKMVCAICAAVCTICLLVCACYLFNAENFSSWDLEMVMAAMIARTGPWLLAGFAAIIALELYKKRSIIRELHMAKDAPPCEAAPKDVTDEKKLPVLRAVLLCTAIALLGAGIFNGGMYDVLVKAINICTECIGLG